jgi:hypothetical protein
MRAHHEGAQIRGSDAASSFPRKSGIPSDLRSRKQHVCCCQVTSAAPTCFAPQLAPDTVLLQHLWPEKLPEWCIHDHCVDQVTTVIHFEQGHGHHHSNNMHVAPLEHFYALRRPASLWQAGSCSSSRQARLCRYSILAATYVQLLHHKYTTLHTSMYGAKQVITQFVCPVAPGQASLATIPSAIPVSPSEEWPCR